MPLTLEERERIAYIEGRTGEAELLQQAIEAEGCAITDLREERDDLKKDAGRLERENDELQEQIETAEEKALTLSSQLENAQDEIKALRSEIREKCLDLL